MRYFAITLLLLFPMPLLSQTTVGGNQSGTWTAAASPYLVSSEIIVPSGQVLTIEPGVEVDFQGHYKFTVNGDLQAIGAVGDTILFTTDDPAVGWGGIRISTTDICSLSYCRIEYGKTAGDYPDMHGGGMALLSSDAVVSHCVFSHNDATAGDNGMGGAVYAINTGGSAGPLTRFSDCRFIGNHAYGEGGAIKFTGDMNTEITGCEFYENDCLYGGGAISCYAVDGTKMSNCVFADNYTMYSAGGAVNTLGSWNTVFFANCTFTGNSAVTGDGGAINIANAETYFVNTIIFDNQGMYSDDLNLDFGGYGEVYYSDMSMPDGATGHDNIDQDPLFAGAATRDFHLTESSPCIDTGIAYLTSGSEVLVDLSPEQYIGAEPDMGAYEYAPATGVGDASPTACRLYQNYPNPFTNGTSINYRLAAARYVTVRVYNVRGQQIRSLVADVQPEGGHTVFWDGRNDAGRSVSPGTYFLKLRSGNEIRGTRMVLSR